MLSGSFLQLSNVNHQAGSITGEILFNEAHDIFKGHFPSIPVVPGVCMMQAIKEITALQTGYNLWITKASQLKFMNPINPLITPSVLFNIHYTSNNDVLDITAELRNPAIVFFKMKATFSLKD
jgi:3-hydroxyacyl-[acyl-carrier-protein] dehydratase